MCSYANAGSGDTGGSLLIWFKGGEPSNNNKWQIPQSTCSDLVTATAVATPMLQ